MNINKWIQKRSRPRKIKPKAKQKLTGTVAKKGGAIGNIARQRKRQDKILDEIMKGN